MQEKNNKKIVLSAAVLTLLCSSGYSSFAQEVATSSEVSLKPVTFTVVVGKVTCNGGTGVAKVSLMNEPTVGGYYEVTGDMITKNNITLSREVDLPTGTYLWTGFANNEYAVSGKSSGEFTVGKCTVPAVTSQTLKGVEPTPPVKKIEKVIPKNIEISEMTSEELSSTTGSEKTSSADSTKEQNRNKVIIGIAIFAAVVAYFGFRKEKKEMI